MHEGAERGASQGWLTGGKAEILAVRNDVMGGVSYDRPTIDNILDNAGENAYSIGGPETFASIGDPLAAPENKGGDPENTHPALRNVEAAAYARYLSLAHVDGRGPHAGSGSDPLEP